MLPKFFRYFFFIGLAYCAASCCSPDPSIASLNVPLYPQQTDMWCWAASGQMCMSFLGATVDVSQCTQANNRFGKTNCCNTPTPAECVDGGWPEFDKYGFTFDETTNKALTWEQLTSQISCSKKPVTFTWAWVGGGGHAMVARGYAIVDGDSLVFINNPWEPNVGAQYSITYADYVAGSDHTHWNDFYNITKK